MYPLVRLAEVLAHRKTFITIDDTQTYMRCRVQSYGKGIVLRDIVVGADIKTKQQQVCRAGEFLVAEIDAKVGGFGIVPADLDGAVVSSHYFLFTLDETKIHQSYLSYYVRTPEFQDQVTAQGSTNYAAIRPNHVLEYTIPLPHLDEQRRIVAHIDALAGQIATARGLRHGAVEEAEAVWKSSLNKAFSVVFPQKCDPQSALSQHAKKHADLPQHKHNNASPQNPRTYSEGLFILPNGWIWSDLGSVLTHIVDCVNDTPNFASDVTDYIGLKSTNIRPYSLDLSQIWYVSAEDFRHWNRREQPKGGDIVITREAPLGNACILPDREDLCLTQRLLLLRCDEEFVSNRFILHYLNSPIFLNQVKGLSRGLTHPHLRVGDTPTILIPFSVRSEQDRIVEYLDAMQSNLISLKRLQAATAAELDALLPSLLDRAFRGEW